MSDLCFNDVKETPTIPLVMFMLREDKFLKGQVSSAFLLTNSYDAEGYPLPRSTTKLLFSRLIRRCNRITPPKSYFPSRVNLSTFNMANPLPVLPETTFATPSTSVLDAFKLSAAVRVSASLGITLEQAWDGVESGKVGKNVIGDFSLAIPRFRLKGDPKALAQKIVDNVSPVSPRIQYQKRSILKIN
jgi:hypothetical protein